MPTATALKAEETLIHVLWINAGLSCDGDSVALTAATQPSVEEIALGALPGLPKIAMHWPLIDFECGPQQGADDFLEWFRKADRGELEPFVLVVEGAPESSDQDAGESDRVLSILLSELPVKQAAALAAQITGQKKNVRSVC